MKKLLIATFLLASVTCFAQTQFTVTSGSTLLFDNGRNRSIDSLVVIVNGFQSQPGSATLNFSVYADSTTTANGINYPGLNNTTFPLRGTITESTPNWETLSYSTAFTAFVNKVKTLFTVTQQK